MKFNRVIWTIMSIFMMLIAFQITGCGSSGGGGKAVVEVGTIKLTLSNERLDGNGVDTVTITAEALDTSENAIPNGTELTFASQTMDIDNGQAGIQLTYKATITGGVATATLTAAEVVANFEPTETVTVTVGSVSETIDITIVGPPVAGGLAITSGADSIVADGESKVLVTAVVKDENGNPVADGIPVKFQTTAGIFESYVRIPENPKTVTTVNGVASVYLISSANVGQAKVTITVDGIPKDIFITFTAGPVDHVQITANPASIPYGTPQSSITVKAYDENNNPVGAETLKFVAGDGTFEPSNISTTDANGQALITYVAPVVAATTTDTISVYSTENTLLGTYAITLLGPKVGSIALSTNAPRLNGDGVSQAVITATVKDSLGNNMPDGTSVTFTSQTMDIDASQAGKQLSYMTTTVGGVAAATLTATNVTINFSATETVSAGAQDVSKSLGITILGPPKTLTLSTGSTTVIADGVSKVVITAVVNDDNGNAVADGTQVNFSTTAGSLAAYVRAPVTTMSVPTANGVASIYLVSADNLGQAVVTVDANGIINTTSIQFVAGPIDHVQISASPTSIPFGTAQSTITAKAFDANENPVADETLKFSASQGSFNPSNIAVTDEDGQAGVTFVAPVVATDTNVAIQVKSTANALLGSYQITVEGPKVAAIALSVNPVTLPADNTSEADVKAQLTLLGGGTVPDGINVEFVIKSYSGDATITTPALTQGATGIATATLKAGSTPETITIQASAGGVIQEIQFEFTPGNVSLTIVPNSLLATGQDTAKVTAKLTDVLGAPAENIQVAFSLSDQSLGTITAAGTTDTNGEVVVPFIAAKKGGTVTVIAEWIDGNGDPVVSGSRAITILPPPIQITLAEGSPDPAVINIRGTGGVSTSQITFDISDIDGTAVADGYPFSLNISSGLGGGEEITPTFATTKDGQISVILRSGTKSGPIGIKIVYLFDTKINYDLNNIIITNGPPVGEGFGIAAQHLNVSGLEIAGLEDAITVNVGDVYGNPVPDGTAISFKTYDTGGILSNPLDVGTLDGTAATILRTPGSNSVPLEGFAFVTAEANNSGRSTHITSIDSYFDGQSELVYAGTDGGGVYKSTNGGWTWANVSRSSVSVGQNVIDPYVNDVSIDPDDPNTIFAATGYLGRGNIYRSVNGGYSWNSNENPEEWYGIFSDNNAVLSVLCDDGSDYVWAGTAGRGVVFVENGDDSVVNFHWGGWIEPTAPTVWQDPSETILTNPSDAGNGTISNLSLSATSVTEDWALTYERVGIETTAPFLTDVSGSQADGTLTINVVDENALTETWTATYIGGYGAKVIPVGDIVGYEDGILYVEEVNGNLNEVWTVSCTDTAPLTFSVAGSVSGANADVTDITQAYTTDGGEVTFRILKTGAFTVGDTFIFSTTYDSKSRILNANGELFITSLSPYTKTEDWKVTCVDATKNQFEVVSKRGTQTVNHGLYEAIPGQSFTSSGGELTFFITETGAFVNGDVFTFHTIADGWRVDGSVSGDQTNIAKTNTLYTVDNADVSFTISFSAFLGANFYGTGDFWQFGTMTTANWKVAGSKSGVQENRAENGIPYVSDGYEVRFLIEEGSTPFIAGDTFTFTLNESGLGENRTVRDIVKKPGTSGAGAALYAATGKGVYTSINGGLQWLPTTRFVGDNIMAIAHHPVQNAIYTGTESAGVRYSIDNGVTWVSRTGGLGKGLNATSPEPDVYNTGTGIMTIAEVGRAALSETWTVTCEEEIVNGGRFSVLGSRSGDVTGGTLYDISTGNYVIPNVLTFTIADGYLDFVEGDTFTFNTTRDDELSIKDLAVVSDGIVNANDRLYAITYFEGALEPHAVSNLYSIGIDETTGALKNENWIESNAGLPQFEPPDDTTLFAQHCLAYDNGSLFIGGQGINFYQASAGLDTGAPAWIKSVQGMTNRIMTRMPVLFSGDCDMVISQDSNGGIVTFTVYIQDVNGNPPIAGSDLTVKQKIGDEEKIIFHYTYADGYIAPGTWRDVTNPATNNPFMIGPTLDIGEFTFTYTPTCETTAPGCSGSLQEVKY